MEILERLELTMSDLQTDALPTWLQDLKKIAEVRFELTIPGYEPGTLDHWVTPQ